MLNLLRVPRHSPHDRDIYRLALPAFGALVAEPLYRLTDTAVVGRLGTVPLGGLALASTVLNTLVWVFNFLSYGTTVRVAVRAEWETIGLGVFGLCQCRNGDNAVAF